MLSFVRVFRLVHVLLPVPYTPSGTFLHVSATSIECRAGLDVMTLRLCFGSYELGPVLPLVCVSHPSPATCVI